MPSSNPREFKLGANGKVAIEVTDTGVEIQGPKTNEKTVHLQRVTRDLLQQAGIKGAIAADPTNGALYAVAGNGDLRILPFNGKLEKLLAEDANEEIIDRSPKSGPGAVTQSDSPETLVDTSLRPLEIE